MSEKKEEIKALRAGDILFQQNDQGGDLYFIQEGTIEIVSTQDNQEYILTTMGAGEILGAATCLNRDPRLASARAKTDVLVKLVPHESIKKAMGEIPKWMNIVLKDLILRLVNMNKQFAGLKNRVAELEKYQIDGLHIGTQFSACAAVLSGYLEKEMEGEMRVTLDDLLPTAEAILREDQDNLTKFLNIFQDAGILKIEKEPGKTTKYIPSKNLKALENFAQFAQQARFGKMRKLLKSDLGMKDFKILRSILQFVKTMKVDFDKKIQLAVNEVDKSLERVTKTTFKLESVQKAAKFELVTLEGDEEDLRLSFVPRDLSRILANIIVYNQMRELKFEEEANEAA